jgi:hypothetical protein
VAITSVSPHLVAATTLNQVITVTGTGFDEASISSVTIAGCTTAPTYIVASPTSLVLKTAVDCAAGATGAALITITDTSSNTAVTTATTAKTLSFVAPPTIKTETASVHPITTENTNGQAYADQVASAPTKGGTVIRVTAGATGFSTTTAFPLSASLGGVALTAVHLVGVNAAAGNYFTGVTGAHPAADAAPVLKITNNGVSKSFAFNATPAAGVHDFAYAGSSISVSPAFGPDNAVGSVLTITGTGFSTTAGNDTVTIGGVSCPVSGTPTATSIKCNPAAVIVPGPKTVQVAVTGGLTSVVGANSTYTYVAQ